ncbi:AI-2E family transporter [Escherichia coli]
MLPRNRGLAGQVWKETNQQITNYIRGKVLEMIVVGAHVDWLYPFWPQLFAAAGGAGRVRAINPHIGAFVVTIPVVGVALFQFGAGTEFGVRLRGPIIQALDGNLLVPVLFSEAVNPHPLVIILSVVIFGGLWGFWGVSSLFRWRRSSKRWCTPGRMGKSRKNNLQPDELFRRADFSGFLT